MPARSSGTFHCDCSICILEGPRDTDGRPLGRDLPNSQRQAHLVRIQDDVASSSFNEAFLESEDNSTLQAHRLWSSRSSLPATSPSVPPNIQDSSLDAIVSGLHALTLSTSRDGNEEPFTVAISNPPNRQDNERPSGPSGSSVQDIPSPSTASGEGPLLFDSSHYFNPPVNLADPVAQITMFIVVVFTVVVGISRRMGDLLLGLLSVLLRQSFSPSGKFDAGQENILSQLPLTAETVLNKFQLGGKVTTYAVCPECHCTYAPEFLPDSDRPIYPTKCTNKPFPDVTCEMPLLEASDGHLKPIKIFEHYSLHEYMANLLSLPDLESMMDRTCDDLMTSIRNNDPPPTFITDVFDADYIRNFRGRDGKLFIDREGTDGRYLFVLNFDFFTAERNTVRGPSASCGLISAACLNLPLHLRYKPEYMYIAGIVPGPTEPSKEQLNHYMRLVVDDFSVSWERGVHFSCTANHPEGRNTSSAIAIAVSDLPAARKVAQFAGHTSHYYCTRCHCYHKTTMGRTDVDHPDWNPRSSAELRCIAEAWRSAPNAIDQEAIFKESGIRWTEFWRLPYWDPPRMLAVDSMHCLLEGLAQFQFRVVLDLTEKAADQKGNKDGITFEFNFAQPNETDDIYEEVLKIHRILQAPLIPTSDKPDENLLFDSLAKRLESQKYQPLYFVMSSLGLKPASEGKKQGRGSNEYTKHQCAVELVEWRKKRDMYQLAHVKYGTSAVMSRIKEVIRDMDTPSWLRSVPRNFGEASAGSLKADEWRTMTTVYLPVALVSMWGEGTTHPSSKLGSELRSALDHTMDLVSAISLACMNTTTPKRISDYWRYIVSWLSSLQKINPKVKPGVNCHVSLHIYDFLLLFGPVCSWWCFPFERLIGKLQRLPSNHKFGQLESTMISSFIRGSKLRHWLSRPGCPAGLKECRKVFDSVFSKETEEPDLADIASSYQPTPVDLKHLIPETPRIRLRARYKLDGVIYSRVSTHVGNSLVMFNPQGRAGKAVPASIKYIVDEPSRKFFVVQRQLQAEQGTIDPFTPYEGFPAKIFSTEMASELEIVEPDWVVAHYARWNMDDRRAVVLPLFRD